MAILTDHDEQDQPTSPSKSKPKPIPKSKVESNPRPEPSTSNSTPNPFKFWFYFTTVVSLITFLFVFLSSLSSPDPKTWFLTLPTTLRIHYSAGRTIKVQINPNQPQVEVFTYSKGSRKSSENVLIIHGLGCSSFSFKGIVDGLASNGLFGVAIDLPGSGFSDKAVEIEKERVLGSLGFLGRVLDVIDEIKEKGIFWGFDNLVEHGQLPYQEVKEVKIRVSKYKVNEPLSLGVYEVSRVIKQVVDVLGLAPVHLVLHDSALVMAANWVVENERMVRSVTLLDSGIGSRGVALPLSVLEVPVVREVVLRVNYLFDKVIGSCCSRNVGSKSVEAHRILLNGMDGRAAIVGMGKMLNQSFDLGEWVNSDGLKGLPMQVLWSGNWSEEWSEEGKRVAEVVSQGRLIKHSGGRWPQEDTSSAIADEIISFVSSLPKTERKIEDEPVPEHIQKLLDEAKAGGHHHHHGHGEDSHGGHAHDHVAHAGYMDGYGLGQGWGM